MGEPSIRLAPALPEAIRLIEAGRQIKLLTEQRQSVHFMLVVLWRAY